MTFFRTATFAAVAFSALAAASAAAPAADLNAVTQREVLSTKTVGGDVEITYGKPIGAVTTRNILKVEFGAGGDPVITYGDEVYPVISREVASVRRDGDGLSVTYKDVDATAYRQLTERVQNGGVTLD